MSSIRICALVLEDVHDIVETAATWCVACVEPEYDNKYQAHVAMNDLLVPLHTLSRAATPGW